MDCEEYVIKELYKTKQDLESTKQELDELVLEIEQLNTYIKKFETLSLEVKKYIRIVKGEHCDKMKLLYNTSFNTSRIISYTDEPNYEKLLQLLELTGPVINETEGENNNE